MMIKYKNSLLCLFLALLTIATPTTGMATEWDDLESNSRLYMDGKFPSCIECETIVVIFSTAPLDRQLLRSLQRVAGKTGRGNIASTLKRSFLLDHASNLRGLNCSMPASSEPDVVYFAFVPEGKCIKLAFADQVTLRAGLERFYAYIDTPPLSISDLRTLKAKEDSTQLAKSMITFLGEYSSILKDLVPIIAQRILKNEKAEK